MGVDELKKELKALQEKREADTTIKNLKRQIRAEKFGQTKTGKIFNKIADVGDVGLKATSRYLSQPNPQTSGKKKKKKPIKTVEEIMASLPQLLHEED